MLVSEIMSRELVTISSDKRVSQALQLMQQRQVRHLPVMEGGRMVGWITSRDLREVLLASMLEKITVAEVMIKAPISVTADTVVEEAARLVQEHKIGGMPVLEGDRLVGVITMMDLIGAFLILLSLLKTSSRLDLLLEDKPEAMEAAAKIIKKAGGKILNLALGPVRGHQRSYSVRLQKADLGPIVDALEQQGIKVQDVIP
ncbi:MAG: CBS and ACT domain-containing protein [Desulfobaccales bacterium]|jgi:acetoin utilization protein AcuB